MRLRHNKIFIFFLDFLSKIVFLIPLIVHRFCRQKYSSLPQSILVIELWGLGDLTLMSPVLESLRINFPKAKVTLLSKLSGKILFKDSPYVDEFVVFDFPWTHFRGKYKLWNWKWKELFRIISLLRSKRFDLSLDARGDFRNNLLSFFINARRRLGYKWTGGGCFLTDVVSNQSRSQHRLVAWLNLLSYLKLRVASKAPSLQVFENEKKWADEFLKNKNINSGDLIVGIHPGAGAKLRCWPLGRFADLIDHLVDKYQAKVILFVEPDGYGEDLPARSNVIKAKLNLREFMALVAKMDLFICNDSGVMHIASGVNIPVVAIFGPGELSKFSPYGDKHRVIINKNIQCRPCFDNCRYKEPFCITDTSVDKVLKCVDKSFLNIINQKA